MRKLAAFFAYNNVVPIGFFVLFGIATSVIAASPEAQEALYAAHEEVRSVDNTYVASMDPERHDFEMQITEVKENVDNFYISYNYADIAIVDYVWQTALTRGTLTVSKKEVLGLDLGLFVAKQLKEVINAKKKFFADVKAIESAAGVTPKVVATVYSGLIGKYFDPLEEEFPGYTPVVAAVVLSDEDAVRNRELAGVAAGSARSTNISLPKTLSQSEIEHMVASQVRAILSGETENTLATQNTPTESGTSADSPLPSTSSGDASSPTETTAGSEPPSEAASTTPTTADDNTDATDNTPIPPEEVGTTTPTAGSEPPSEAASTTPTTADDNTDSADNPQIPPEEVETTTPTATGDTHSSSEPPAEPTPQSPTPANDPSPETSSGDTSETSATSTVP